MGEFVRKYIPTVRQCTVMDIGSQLIDGQQELGSYKNLFADMPGVTYKGLDMAEGLNVDLVLKSPYNWSDVPANSADFVISGQMLEHVEFPGLRLLR